MKGLLSQKSEEKKKKSYLGHGFVGRVALFFSLQIDALSSKEAFLSTATRCSKRKKKKLASFWQPS